jgi:pimeloyl-ACP methyl ester carboxylesterase
VRIVELNRASVRVRDVGSGPPLIFTPDCPCVIEHYVAIQDALAREGVRTVCFDLPGFGFSKPRDGYDYGVAHGARIVLELMDALSIDKASLAFSCANGFYALGAAKAAPARIERLILSQTPSTEGMRAWGDRMIPRVLRMRHLGQAFMRIVRRPASRHWYRIAVAKDRSPAPFQKIADDALASGGAYRLADMVQGLVSTRDSDLEPVSAPTTVVWGMRDRSHGTTPPDTLLRHVPDAEIVHFEDAGHFPDLEAPDRFVALVLDRVAR